MTYWLDGEYAANFTIDVVTGQVRPVPPGVDRERLDADIINVTLIARDQGYPLQQQSVATLVIAVNVRTMAVNVCKRLQFYAF